jgi:chloramphenicol 3-O-phosphotransferase
MNKRPTLGETNMIVILNGSVGVGKTAVSCCLSERFKKSVMLDGDYIGAVHPFEIYDSSRIDYLNQTLAHLISFHKTNGYSDFVVNYVFENADELKSLVDLLHPICNDIFSFRLTCSEEEQEKRILDRHTDQLEWERSRFKALNGILEKSAKDGNIGSKIDTTGMSVKEVAADIWARMKWPLN